MCQLAAAQAFGLAVAGRKGTEGRCSIPLVWLRPSALGTAGGAALAKQHCMCKSEIMDHFQFRKRLAARGFRVGGAQNGQCHARSRLVQLKQMRPQRGRVWAGDGISSSRSFHTFWLKVQSRDGIVLTEAVTEVHFVSEATYDARSPCA